MKKRKGFSIIEMIMAISLIAIVVSVIYINKYSYDSEFDRAVYCVKSDIRKYLIKSSDSYNKYLITIFGDNYKVYKRNSLVEIKELPQNIYLLSGEKKLDFTSSSRFGAPGKGSTLYVFNNKTKKLERITIMVGSGRIYSYNEKYGEKKVLIDSMMSNIGK